MMMLSVALWGCFTVQQIHPDRTLFWPKGFPYTLPGLLHSRFSKSLFLKYDVDIRIATQLSNESRDRSEYLPKRKIRNLNHLEFDA